MISKLQSKWKYVKLRSIFCQMFVKAALVFFSLFTFTVHGVHTNLLVVLLQSCQILTGFGEFTFLHTLSDIPVNKGTLGIHQVKFVIKTGPGLSNSSSVGQHANSPGNLGQVTTGNNSWWLVVDTDLETSGPPVNKLN